MMDFRTGRCAMSAGEVVEGDARQPFLLTLYSGWALRLRPGAGGKETVLGVAMPGDLVGMQTIVTDRGALRLRALTDITFCQFHPARWRELLATPGRAERFFRIEALARRDAEERRASAAHLPAAGNLCHLLLGFYDNLLRRRLAREGSFHLPLARKELASLLGMTTMHLRRQLTALAKDGVLELRDGRVTFLNLAKARYLAGNPRRSAAPRPLL